MRYTHGVFASALAAAMILGEDSLNAPMVATVPREPDPVPPPLADQVRRREEQREANLAQAHRMLAAARERALEKPPGHNGSKAMQRRVRQMERAAAKAGVRPL